MKISNLQLFSTPALASDTATTSAPKIATNTALFLDFDGTLVDIAPQHDLVVIPPGLVVVLAQLSASLSGALAIVSGRPLDELDAYLAPLKLPLAAEHGAVYRLANQPPMASTPPALQEIVRVASSLAAQHPGLRVEIKSHALALHYRHAPELEQLCLVAMAQAVERSQGIELLHGKCVLEAKPAGVSKGTAIQALMRQPPFRGRVALFAGDDTTDEAGFAAVQAMGGGSVKIGAGSSLAHFRCADPLTFRQWLASSAGEMQQLDESERRRA
jgi:trehalose 6-phosphate phosphatase